MYKPFLHILLLLLPAALVAQQNLVPNPSFEEYISCPESRVDWENVVAWYSPTWGSPDIHHSCLNATWGEQVPQNVFGWQWPRTGEAYAGAHTAPYGSPNSNDVREYIQCELLESLVQGNRYIVEFFVSSADSAQIATDNIGALLSTEPVSSNDALVLPYSPQVVSPLDQPIADVINWVRIRDTVEAQGNERYITIGVFTDNANTDWVLVDESLPYREPFYYIDDVSVIPMVDSVFIPTVFTPNGDGKNDMFSISYTGFLDGELTIYNRWGRMAFSISGEILEWDAARASAGVYYVMLAMRTTKGNRIVKKGFVHLLR